MGAKNLKIYFSYCHRLNVLYIFFLICTDIFFSHIFPQILLLVKGESR